MYTTSPPRITAPPESRIKNSKRPTELEHQDNKARCTRRKNVIWVDPTDPVDSIISKCSRDVEAGGNVESGLVVSVRGTIVPLRATVFVLREHLLSRSYNMVPTKSALQEAFQRTQMSDEEVSSILLYATQNPAIGVFVAEGGRKVCAKGALGIIDSNTLKERVMASACDASRPRIVLELGPFSTDGGSGPIFKDTLTLGTFPGAGISLNSLAKKGVCTSMNVEFVETGHGVSPDGTNIYEKTRVKPRQMIYAIDCALSLRFRDIAVPTKDALTMELAKMGDSFASLQPRKQSPFETIGVDIETSERVAVDVLAHVCATFYDPVVQLVADVVAKSELIDACDMFSKRKMLTCEDISKSTNISHLQVRRAIQALVGTGVLATAEYENDTAYGLDVCKIVAVTRFKLSTLAGKTSGDAQTPQAEFCSNTLFGDDNTAEMTFFECIHPECACQVDPFEALMHLDVNDEGEYVCPWCYEDGFARVMKETTKADYGTHRTAAEINTDTSCLSQLGDKLAQAEKFFETAFDAEDGSSGVREWTDVRR